MAIRPLNSVAGFSVGETPTNIILANGDITTTNITTTGVSNLNSIGNVKITGGTGGQVISTDGAGNLTFITVSTAGLSNGTSNIAILNNGNITFSVGGNANVGVFTGTGINVAGYLTATSNVSGGNLTTGGALSVTGNANVGNLGTAQVLATANITAPQLISNVATGTAPLSVSSTTLVSNLNADLLDGYNTATANTASTVVVRDASGNVSANYFIGDGSQLTGIGDAASIANGTSNVRIPTVNGNVNISSAGNANIVVVTGTGVNVAGTLNATGNANIGNLGTAQVLATANVTAPQLVSNVSTGIAPFIVTSTTQVANLSVATAGTAGSATTAGTVTTNAQPNITSVGTLSSLAVTGNISGGNLSTAGTITANGGSYGEVVTTQFASVWGSGGGPNPYSIMQVRSSDGVSGLGMQAFTGSGTLYGNTAINFGLATIRDKDVPSGLVVKAYIDSTGFIANGIVSANGNVSGTQLISNIATGTAPLVVTSTTQVANLNAATAGTAGTVTTAAQPNITSVGTLTSLDVTGNVSGGNLTTGGAVVATGNVSGGNLTTGGIVNATGNIVSGANVVTDLIVGKTASVTITAVGSDQNVNLVPTGNGSVNVGNFIISNVATPIASTDAATKQYVDDVAQGLHTHDSCNAATSTTLAVTTGGTVTYNNGASGVGANLVTTGSFNLIDGVNVQTSGTRILVKDEANTAHNGIYVWSNATVITRADDFNTPTEMAGGDFTFVTAGTLYDNTGWVMPDPVTTVGTSPVVWVQFSGAGTYTAGTGLVLNGNQFSIGNTTVTAGAYGNGDYNATFTVNEQGQLSAAANVAITANAANLTGTTLASTIVNSSLTSVGTLTSLAVTGNATAGNVYANSGTIGASLLTGTLTTAAQPNVTSVGTLTSLTVTGTATAGNLSTGGTLSVTGNANVGNLGTGGLIVATGNITGGNLVTGGVVAATGNVSGGNLTTAGALAVTGNASVGNLSATNGNLTTANVSGNIILGNASVTTAISWASATTTAITANQTIASFSVTGVTGVEFVVKGIDSTGSKYSVATVQAVTDGTDVDYSTFGTVNLGGFTGSLAVNVVGGFVRLQVTPASSNSTVWTTQYRFI